MKKEWWRPIKDYEGLYEVSNKGRIKSLERAIIRRIKGKIYVKERILKPCINRKGYLQVCLSKDGKQKMYRVHRLVAETFIPNPDNLPQVNHKDECKTNNIPENLEWCDNKYNTTYGTARERGAENCKKPILQIDPNTDEIIKEWVSAKDVERALGIYNSNICVCLKKGKQKTAGGYKWKYKEEDN